jgi:hypothetical protein
MQMLPPEPGAQRTVLLDEPAPAPKPAARRSRWPTIAVVAAIVLVLGLILGDWVARNVETSNLLDRIERSEDEMGAAQESIRTASAGAGSTEAKAEALEKAAALSRDQVAVAGEDVAAASFLPWHGSLVTAQAAYLDHNQAWVNYLDAGSRSAATLAASPLDIETTWQVAEVRIREAIPLIPFPGINARVDAIFEEGDQESSGPTIEALAPPSSVGSA